MNLLYTLTSYPPAIGGAQLHQHLIAQNLKNNHHIQVFSHWRENRTDWLRGTTINAPKYDIDYTIDDITVHQMGLSLKDKINLLPAVLIYYPLMKIALPKIANCIQEKLEPYAQKADLIHNVRIGREGLSYASLQAAKKYNIPFILTPVHHPRWVGWRYKAYNQLYQLADHLIALTQAEKQILISLGVAEENITVTGNGSILSDKVDPITFKEKYQIDEPIILFLGQHYSYKGYQQLLQATSLVWQKVSDAQFVFIGPSVGQSETYFQHYQDKRIHRLGGVNLQDKTNSLAACTLLCVPSTQESFGGVYTEAWSFAKPVIGCKIPTVSEVISDGINGYTVSQNPEEIADAICQLLLNPSQAEKMGKLGQEKVNSQFTWEILAHKTEQIYRRITNCEHY